MKGRHKAGQLQSSEGLRIPNLAQICQRQHPGKQLWAHGQQPSFYLIFVAQALLSVRDPCGSPRLRASAMRFWFADRAISTITAIPAIL
jgi:hypothetical protein